MSGSKGNLKRLHSWVKVRRKPPVHTESLPYSTGERCLPSMGSPLQEKAHGRLYQDTKLGVLEFMSKVINVNLVQNTSYIVP